MRNLRGKVPGLGLRSAGVGDFGRESSKVWKFQEKKFQTLEIFRRKVPNLGNFGIKSSKLWKFWEGEVPRFGDFRIKSSKLWKFLGKPSKPAPMDIGARHAPTDVEAAWEVVRGRPPRLSGEADGG